MDNWEEIHKRLWTKTPQQCELHYYSAYYKSAQERYPTPTNVIVQRAPNGKIIIDKAKERMAKDREEQYVRKAAAAHKKEEPKKEEVKEEAKTISKCINILA